MTDTYKPGLMKRARMAGRVGYRILRGRPIQTKESPFVWPAWIEGQPQWQMVNLLDYYREGYELNSVIHAAISYKVRALTMARLAAYAPDKSELPKTNPLSRLVFKPNMHQSTVEFMQQAVVYLNVAGNNYTYLDRDNANEMPREMYHLRPDRVWIVPGDKGIKGYLYRAEGLSPYNAMPILPDQMMHVKLPNPRDPLEGMGYGLSPLTAMARDSDVDNAVTRHFFNLMKKGAKFTGLLKFNVPMTDAQVAAARDRWMQIYGGVDNWEKVAVLDQGGDYTRIQATADEMGFKELDARNESRILGPLGVPGMLIGVRSAEGSSTFSNFEQADRVFWQNTFRPELRLFEAEYQQFLTNPGGTVAFDLSEVPALQPNVTALVEAAYKMFQMGTPRDMAYEAVGLPMPETPNGKTSYLPINIMPAGSGNKPTPVNEPGKGREIIRVESYAALLPAKAQTGWTNEQKDKIANGLNDVKDGWEPKFMEAGKTAFENDRRAILAIVNEEKRKSLDAKATIDWLAVMARITLYLSNAAPGGWRETFVPVMAGLVEDVGDYWSVQLGLTWNVRNFRAEEWFTQYTLVFADPITATSESQLAALLQQAQREGWSIPTTQGHMETLFRQWINGNVTPDDWAFADERLPNWRTELIARTEITRAAGGGTQALFEEWNVQKKEWLSTMDARCRPTHVAANHQVRAIDAPFDIGGFDMMHPGDMSMGAPLKEVAACRCTELPVIETEEGE